MPQMEYSDFYKFVVSLGVTLVIAAVLLPWVFLREPFDLRLASNELSNLTPAAQNILAERQAILSRTLHFIPLMSGTLLVLGGACTVGGLWRWRRRQAVRDESENLAVEKLRRELIPMSADEKDAKIAAEVVENREAPLAEPTLVANAEQTASADSYREMERKLYDRAKHCLDDAFVVQANQRLGPAELDLVLMSRVAGTPDTVIELKPIRRGFQFGWLRESASRLVVNTELYNERLRRRSVPLLLIIGGGSLELSEGDFVKMRRRVMNSLAEVHRPLRIELVAEEKLSTMSCEEVRTLLLGY